MGNTALIREIHTDRITSEVARLCQEANYNLGQDVVDALHRAKSEESSEAAKSIISQIILNQEIARKEIIPICQDTGLTIVFVELGQDVHIIGMDLIGAINSGVSKGYREGYLRKSIVADPIGRKNTGDNTPAVIHVEIVPGDKLKITVAPKGGGSENVSEAKSLSPTAGVEGITKYVLDLVKRAGGKPCPPIIIGIGLGGSIEKAMFLAKKSLLRSIGHGHRDPRYLALEKEILEEVNATGIGSQGMGGSVTALAVHIEYYPCHIASLPIAVSIQCHAARHKTVVI